MCFFNPHYSLYQFKFQWIKFYFNFSNILAKKIVKMKCSSTSSLSHVPSCPGDMESGEISALEVPKAEAK
jgi:hypothetical protein